MKALSLLYAHTVLISTVYAVPGYRVLSYLSYLYYFIILIYYLYHRYPGTGTQKCTRTRYQSRDITGTRTVRVYRVVYISA